MKLVHKRFWSLLLAVAMVLTMMPLTAAYAATGLDTELVANGGAEAGNISGWTDDTGAGRWSSGTAYSTWAKPAAGSRYFFLYNPSMDTPLSGTMSQEITLTGTEGSGVFSAISNGNVSIRFSVSLFQGISSGNEAKAVLEEYAANGSLLKTSQVVNTTSSGTAMGQYQINTQINPGTRKFKIILSATLTKGGYAQFDQVSLKLVDTPVGSAPVFGSDFPLAAETDAGFPYTANFTVSDADAGDIDHLTFSTSSTNVNLVPAANITISGSGASRTLKILPAGNLSGEADITVVASDGAKSADKTFHFIVHKVISMNTNLVENGNGTNGLAGWSGNTVNINPTGSGFRSNDPNSSMSQNIDISKFSPLIDGGETEFLMSAAFPLANGKVSAQFYTDIACTNPVGSSSAVVNSVPLQQKIPANTKGVKITFDNTCEVYDNVEVGNISFQIVNNFPKISSVSAKMTDLSALTVPIYTYYTTSNAVLTANSSDQTVVPNEGISIGGSGFKRSISFTPLKNGSVTISLTLNDGSKTVTSSFAVTVHEPAKVISVSSPAQGFYGAGNNLDFTVHFNYPVTGGTSSTLPLTIGGVPAAASYLTSTADSITYRYTAGTGSSGVVAAGMKIDDTSSPIVDTAGYDAEVEINTGALVVMLVPAPQVTSTALGGSSDYGTKVTLTATLNCAESLSGAIQFKANGTNLGNPVAISGNMASYETAETALAAGAVSITAEFIPSGTDFHFNSLTGSGYIMNINRRALTIKPNPAVKVYGTADPALDYLITNGALAGSDVLTGSLDREAGEAVGEYEIKQGTVTNGNNANYDITFVTGVKLSVTPLVIVDGTISPKTGSFDRKIANQADIQAAITWNSAAGITDVKSGGVSIGTDNYSVSGNTLTIKKGYLALQAPGTLVLTVVFDQGIPDTLTISVIDTTSPAIPVTGITVTGAGGRDSVKAGDTLQMQAGISPDNAASKEVTWSIKSGNGASIDAAGLLKAAAAGIVIVRATAQDGSGVYGEKTITITEEDATVKIVIAQSPVKSILHAITFGLFFNDTVDVSITSESSKIDHYEYQIVKDGSPFDKDGTWTIGDSFSISPDFKGRVYARAVYGGGTVSAAEVKALVVDHTKPAITAAYDASSASITVSIKDDGAGIEKISYQAGSGTEQTINLEPSETQDIITWKNFTINGLPDGRYDVVINAADNAGNAADTKTISVDQGSAAVDASISPAARSYDLAAPGDVSTGITWNSASTVTDVVYQTGSVRLTETKDYVVTGSGLTIKSSCLKSLNLPAGASAKFTVSFDTGNPVTFTVDFVDNYIPGTNARLSRLTVNGKPVGDFEPDKTGYEVKLPYGTALVTVGAAAEDPHATVDITQAGTLPGTAVVGVTAEDSAATKTYTINFTLENPVPVHRITVQNDGNGTASADLTFAAAGQTVTLNGSPNRGYQFKEWQAISPAGLSITGNTFIMPDEAVTVNAIFKAAGSGEGGNSGEGSGTSSGNSTIVPVPTPENKRPDQPITAEVSVTAVAGSKGTFGAAIPDKAISDAIAQARAAVKSQGETETRISMVLNIAAPKGRAALFVTLSQDALKALADAGVSSLEINGLPVSIRFDRTALHTIRSQSKGNVTITAVSGQNLSDEAKARIGTRPVYNITIGYGAGGSSSAVRNLGGGTATVSVPYTPARGEAAGCLYVVYVDGNGRTTRMGASAYDANSGCLIFTTSHFSVYGIGYTAPTAKFSDISMHWAKDSIDYAVSRGLISGTAKTTFSPDAAMTRGMLATALGKLSDADVKGCKTSSFTDVKAGSTFQPYIEWAYRKGIIEGVSSSQFAPDKAVTREETAVIMQNYAKVTGYTLPVTRQANTFGDSSAISGTCQEAVKAMQQAGIMMGGSNNNFRPGDSITRAEVSAILYRYIKLNLDSGTAQGWAINDSGEKMYFQDGKALTGWQDIETGGNTKRYYFDTNAVMAAGKWLLIGGNLYYFHADGSLAVSTKIDGWEVGADGVRKTK